MNPYASWIEGRDPMAVLTATPEQLSALIERIGSAGMKRSLEPGKWNVSQILTHLAQCELAFSHRIRQAASQTEYVAQSFDQDQWMSLEPVAEDDRALQAFVALRNWNLGLYRSFSAADRARAFHHPHLGEQSVQELLELIAGHELNHLAQLEQIASQTE